MVTPPDHIISAIRLRSAPNRFSGWLHQREGDSGKLLPAAGAVYRSRLIQSRVDILLMPASCITIWYPTNCHIVTTISAGITVFSSASQIRTLDSSLPPLETVYQSKVRVVDKVQHSDGRATHITEGINKHSGTICCPLFSGIKCWTTAVPAACGPHWTVRTSGYWLPPAGRTGPETGEYNFSAPQSGIPNKLVLKRLK